MWKKKKKKLVDGPKRSLSPQKRLQATSSVPAASGDMSIKARLSIIPPH